MDATVQKPHESDSESERNLKDSEVETHGNLGASDSLTNQSNPKVDEEGYEVVKRKKKTKSSKAKSLQTAKFDSDSMNTSTPSRIPTPNPFFKVPNLKDSRIFLWNAGGKRR